VAQHRLQTKAELAGFASPVGGLGSEGHGHLLPPCGSVLSAQAHRFLNLLRITGCTAGGVTAPEGTEHPPGASGSLSPVSASQRSVPPPGRRLFSQKWCEPRSVRHGQTRLRKPLECRFAKCWVSQSEPWVPHPSIPVCHFQHGNSAGVPNGTPSEHPGVPFLAWKFCW
jgi:hypothetical protein